MSAVSAAVSLPTEPGGRASAPLSLEQRRLIRESFAKIEPALGLVASLFYLRLFDLDPSLRRLFRGPIKEQTQKLADAMKLVVMSLDHQRALTPALKLLGARQRRNGVKGADYETFSKALIWTLEQSLEARFTRKTKAAWIALLAQMTTAMA